MKFSLLIFYFVVVFYNGFGRVLSANDPCAIHCFEKEGCRVYEDLVNCRCVYECEGVARRVAALRDSVILSNLEI
ncbi:CLUMA_CG010658, isoform A [Clunio marinus]|uniref:CLUMA_CG010658, isoform A n=1 Tax=Clunio marinus TaxID=568069 RepID=A0A1J1IE33_9DIPT|nr:CLUMA_CG010658, isoform A [Clunio marinus]